MIEEKHEKKSNNNFMNLNLFADKNKSNTFSYKVGDTETQIGEAESIYEEMVQAATTEVPSDSPGVMGGPGYQMSMRLDGIIKDCRIKLEGMGRTDLIEKFDGLLAQIELDKKKKEEQVFLDRIERLIDISKINPEIIPYLVDVEKRLTALEKKL